MLFNKCIGFSKFPKIVICISTVILDQLSKALVVKFYPDLVVYNGGAMLGISFGSALGNELLVGLFLLGFIVLFKDFRGNLGYWLIFGGGLGNVLDRLFYGGRVVDFIPFLGLSVFNLGDLMVVAGVCLLIFEMGRLNVDK